MNGEVSQICNIVIYAKKALRNGTEICYEDMQYVNSIQFKFLPVKTFFGKKEVTVDSIAKWFLTCKKRGLSDIKMLMPTRVENRAVLGFANANRSSIVCFFKSGMVTYFIATWSFNQDKKAWDIVYQEYEWENHPEGIPKFKDNTEAFKAVLLDIEDLARRIGAEGFGNLFHKAYEALSGSLDYELRGKIPDIPSPYQNSYVAIMYADVFGAMGSWNDSPPYMAHEHGLDAEYESLSEELLTQIRLATMYAVNEC